MIQVTKNALTELDLITYFLSGGETMRGKIRAKGYCHLCSGRFKYVVKMGYICPACRSFPIRFYVDINRDGKRIRIFSDKTGQVLDSFERANRILAHINYEIDNHIFDPSRYIVSDVRKFLFENLIEQFYKDKEIEETKGNISPSYLDSLKNYIHNYFIPFFKGKDVRDIRSTDIKEFYQQLPQRKEKTIKNIMDTMRHFFRNLVAFNAIDKVPIFPIVRVSESVPVWVSIDNQRKLLDAVPEQHMDIFSFILFQGCRPSEARALKWKDIDIVNRIVIIRRTFSKNKLVERTKGRNIKPRLIHPLVFEMLSKAPRSFPESFVFLHPRTGKHYSKTRLEVIFKIARERTGIDVNIYAAGRHSVATNAAMAGVDARVIRDYLGHADVRTTEIYTHLDVIAQKQIFEKTSVTRLSPEAKSNDKKP